MTKKNILIIKEQNTNNLDNQPEKYSVTIIDSHEKAIELFHQQNFDLVVVDQDANSIDIKKLNALLPILQDSTVLLSFKGEHADLFEKINEVFYAQKMERLKRMLVLDSTAGNGSFGLPAFSAN
jgi:hypothetical protein